MTPAQIEAREALLETCPLIGVYAGTGTGKTNFLGTLMADDRYQKTLYIDADNSRATIKHLTDQAALCDYRWPRKAVNALMTQQWITRELALAHKVEGVQAIVVEGIARLYEDAVGEAMAQADEKDLTGHAMRRLYTIPSSHIKAVIVGLGNLQKRLRATDRKVPIFFSCNTKARSNDDGKSWDIPALSDANTGILMGRSDAFVELVRKGTHVTIRTDRDNLSSARKVRNPAAALAIAKMRNPTAPGMIQVWADAIANDTQQISNQL